MVTHWFEVFRTFQKFTYEEFVSKTSYIHSDMLPICIIDFLLKLK